jgi:hypothetical protein
VSDHLHDRRTIVRPASDNSPPGFRPRPRPVPPCARCTIPSRAPLLVQPTHRGQHRSRGATARRPQPLRNLIRRGRRVRRIGDRDGQHRSGKPDRQDGVAASDDSGTRRRACSSARRWRGRRWGGDTRGAGKRRGRLRNHPHAHQDQRQEPAVLALVCGCEGEPIPVDLCRCGDRLLELRAARGRGGEAGQASRSA